MLGHLGSAAEIGLATLESGRNDMDRAREVWSRWNAMEPEEQASSFLTTDEHYVAAWEALDDEALATRTVDLGFLPEPVDLPFLASMRLSEVGLHRWDVEVVFDPDATVTAAAVPYALDVHVDFSGFFSKPAGRSGTVIVRTSAPERGYILALTGSGAEVTAEAEATAEPADARLHLPAEALVRLIAGRLGPDHTPASVTVDGAVTLDDLRRCFPGY